MSSYSSSLAVSLARPQEPHVQAGAALHRCGLSLIEIMLSVAILGTVTATVMGGLLSLHVWQRGANNAMVAQRTVQLLSERIMGASWANLGQESDPWSWHRRQISRTNAGLKTDAADWYTVGASPRYKPLTENDPDPNNNLVRMGLLAAGSSIDGLKVYVEYYAEDALNSAGSSLLLRGGSQPVVFPRRAITTAETNVDRGLSEDADPDNSDHLDITVNQTSGTLTNAAILVRVVATWYASDGNATLADDKRLTRSYELLLSRKQ